ASLGWAYGVVTEALGWQHGDGEGKTMGLAAYGDPSRIGDRLDRFFPSFRDGELAAPHEFGRATYLAEGGVLHWHFPEAEAIRALAEVTGRENVAARAQQLLEQETMDVVGHALAQQGVDRLACAGGVFLNVKLNRRLRSAFRLSEHWVFPNPGDAGLAMGAALHAFHDGSAAPPAKLESLFFGPDFTNDEIRAVLDQRGLAYREADDPAGEAARLLADGLIVGWFQGRMESGPRALGNRSILMRPDRAENKDILNGRVKFREGFRPFCPSVLWEKRGDYLADGGEEDFMITAFAARADAARAIPAVVHIDGTMRPQTVRREVNTLFHRLIARLGELTGTFAVLNTSFNLRGEPIVCTPRDAIRCFFDSGLEALVIGSFVLEKPRRRPPRDPAAS
ncbi:MAG: hypothetical protein KIT16_18565, partial [Rhodospirillaceae bacterium]|nr:hypothetical protein [Rhodospirillaceae bacterium]